MIMTYFPDLRSDTQVVSASYVRAVGWLLPSKEFTKGECTPAALSALRRFSERCVESAAALGWPSAGGVHICEFCGRDAACGNFGVAVGDVLFVAPELLVHYVSSHGYLPPSEFLQAIAAAPLPWTPEYTESVQAFRRTERRPN